MSIAKEFVTAKHPVFVARLDEWTINEAAYRGGRHVRRYLQRFYYEREGGSTEGEAHFEARQAAASYVNFPARMAEVFVGYLAAEAPRPGEGIDFGSLGAVREVDVLRGAYSRAELLYYDVDRRGTSYPAFWNEAQKQSIVTGHRWIGVEAPPPLGRAATEADEQNGFRPYLVSLSPARVPQWHYEGGQLQALVVRQPRRRLVKDGAYDGSATFELVLYVRGGFTAFGDTYAGGGFWVFDDEGEALPPLEGSAGIPGEDGAQRGGTLEDTLGEIPYAPLFYAQDDEDFSSAGTSDLSGVALSYMNLSSAGDNDAIEGGARTVHVLGTDVKAFNEALAVKKEGGRYVPIPAAFYGGSPVVPTIYDSGSVSASSAIESAIERKRREAALIAADELIRGANTSGEARLIEFRDVKAPRLALMAVHRQATENFIMRAAQLRFGADDDGSVLWKKDFDVQSDAEDWREVMDAAFSAGVDSPTLKAEGILGLMKAKGIRLGRASTDAIAGEIRDAAAARTQAADDLNRDPVGDPDPDPDGDPPGDPAA